MRHRVPPGSERALPRFGARLQIALQLKDLENFPKDYVWQGSTCLVGKTFESRQEMFASTKEIKD